MSVDNYDTSGSAAKKYKFHIDATPIPPIDRFKLDHILKHELKPESDQVVDSILKVSSNYRKDLKTEIRYKLSIEQKLQNKNIDVAKLAASIDKLILHETKYINKQLNHTSGGTNSGYSGSGPDRMNNLDSEVLPVLQLTDSVSAKFELLAKTLQKLDLKLNGTRSKEFEEAYPMLHSFFNPKVNANLRHSTVSDEPESTEEPTAQLNVSNGKFMDGSLSNGNLDGGIPPSLTNTKPETHFNQVNDHDPSSEHEYNNNNKMPASHDTQQDYNTNDMPDDMNSQEFEAFMSHTLTNYRRQQQERYRTLDVFLDSASLNSGGELYNNSYFDSSLSSSFHRSEDPVSFLYVKPELSNTTKENHQGKSPAIVTQNLQTSHFKKLRISGAPITSASFKKDCECHNDNHNHQNGQMDLEVLGMQVLRNLARSSPGISTPDEEISEISDEAISSESSDSDSSGSTQGLASDTDSYYSSLNDSFKDKRKRQKQRSKQLQHTYTRNYSPTPKHEPSHRILKPKGSILKFSNQNVLPKKIISRRPRSIRSQSPASTSFTERPTPVNNPVETNSTDLSSPPPPMFPISRQACIGSLNDTTAHGIFVSPVQEQSFYSTQIDGTKLPAESIETADEESSDQRIRSITKLRPYVT